MFCERDLDKFFVICRIVGSFILLLLINDIKATDNVTCEVKIRNDPFDSGFQTIRTQTVYCEFDEAIDITNPSTLSNSVNENVTELLMNHKKKIHYLPQEASVAFPNIHAINAYGCSVKSLNKLNFKGLTKLGSVHLDKNQIETIDENSFDDTVDLGNLYLNDNKLIDLPSKVFEKLEYLDGLYVKNNQLRSLDAVLFKNNKNLAALHLTDNKLQTLPSGIFDGLTKVRQIWLNGNEIQDLPPNIFDDCSAAVLLTWTYHATQLKLSMPAGC